MQKNECPDWVWFIVAVAFALLFVRETYIHNSLKEKAIEINYAEYNNATGKWQWKETK